MSKGFKNTTYKRFLQIYVRYVLSSTSTSFFGAKLLTSHTVLIFNEISIKLFKLFGFLSL